VNNVIGPTNGGTLSSIGGVKLDPGSSPAPVFVNNTVAYNSSLSTAVAGIACGGATVTNSIIWGNAGAQYGSPGCTFVSSYVQNGLIADPLFVDFTKGDFHLQTSPAASPCINAGADTTATTKIDITGTSRLKGTAVDMGAYEMQ
jgi:hypothetical protein